MFARGETVRYNSASGIFGIIVSVTSQKLEIRYTRTASKKLNHQHVTYVGEDVLWAYQHWSPLKVLPKQRTWENYD